MPNLNGTRTRGNEILRYGRADNPSGPVIPYTLTPDELAALNASLPPPAPAWRVYTHKPKEEESMLITRAQYLAERFIGTSKDDICAKFGITPAGLKNARIRWGISTEAKEVLAIREHAGVTLTPARDKPSILAAQESATATETGEVAQEVAATADVEQEGTRGAVEVRTPTQEEREGMFAGDAGAWGTNGESKEKHWSEAYADACERGLDKLKEKFIGCMEDVPSDPQQYITIRIPFPATTDINDTATTAAQTRRALVDATEHLRMTVEDVAANLTGWTGSATVEQVQAWVDKAVGV